MKYKIYFLSAVCCLLVTVSQGQVVNWLLAGNTPTTQQFLGTTNSTNLRFKTNGTERMVILSGGNVGIGNTNPGQALDVTGTVRTTGLIVTGSSPAVGKFLTSTDANGTVTWSSVLPIANGGTNLSALGTANQLLRVNAAGTALEYFTPSGGGAVSSVFGRTGAIVAQANDYTFAQIGNTPTTLAGYGITDAALAIHNHTLDGLSNVSTAGKLTNDLLKWNGTNWVNFTPNYLSGNQTITLSGDVTGSGTTAISATIGNDVVTYAKMQNVASNSFLANITGSAVDVQEISTGRIPLFGTAITGTPSSTTFLRGDGTWATPSGGGGGTPAGTNKQVQYNKNGSFAGAEGVEIGNTDQLLKITRQLTGEVPLTVEGQQGYAAIEIKPYDAGNPYTPSLKFTPTLGNFSTISVDYGPLLISGGFYPYHPEGALAATVALGILGAGYNFSVHTYGYGVPISTTGENYTTRVRTPSTNAVGSVIDWGNTGQTADLLQLRKNDYTVLTRFDSAGKLGIGTTADSSLTVAYGIWGKRGVRFSGLPRVNSSQWLTAIDSATGNLSYVPLSALGGGGTSGWSLTGNANTTIANFIGTTDNHSLHFRVNNIERIVVDSATGIVGIGSITTYPTTGNYKLAVAGNIIAEKVRVKLQINGWPDYVFNNEYKLPTLKETEQFIQQYKHLPDVLSAKEIEQDGLDLGDGQAVLLKKIEELTLYMIEMNKKLEKLEAENEMIKKKINKQR
jgi:hypothetical protein